MGRAAVRYEFDRLPSTAAYYPRALFGRRLPLVPEGAIVPRLEGTAARVQARRGHLQRYRKACGFGNDGLLPLTYPHVLAMPLHMALCTHRQFVVRLMGLIHIANDIEQFRPMPEAGIYQLMSWVDGHRDGDRGQEFDLFTEFLDQEGVCWREKSTVLARRAVSSSRAARSVRASLRYDKPAEDAIVRAVEVKVPSAIGRRYGWISGDLNPIHLGDWGARLFGFETAVAHGMWSLARSMAELGETLERTPVRATCEFKLPLFLPSEARLEHWTASGGLRYVLKDSQSLRPHLAGAVIHS